MGRLMLNVLLSFAQLERETIGERTRDKMSAAQRKGKFTPPHRAKITFFNIPEAHCDWRYEAAVMNDPENFLEQFRLSCNKQ